LSRAITNILINAIRYNTAGTTVTCRLHEQSDGITMEFEDDGVGIEKEHQDKIFDHLYRIDAARALKDGTGLGLSIAKKIVELHEGTLTLESDSGKGSLFKIRL